MTKAKDLAEQDKLETVIKAAMRRNPSTAMFMMFYDRIERQRKERTEWLQEECK